MGAAALTQLDTDEVSVVDQGAVRRVFALLKRRGGAMQGTDKVLETVLKMDLPAELETKFKDLVAKLDAGAGAALDPQTKDALKGLLKLLVGFGDKLSDPHLQGLAQLAGFLGNQAPTIQPNADAAGDANPNDDADEESDASDESDPSDTEAGNAEDDDPEKAGKAPPAAAGADPADTSQAGADGKAPPPNDDKKTPPHQKRDRAAMEKAAAEKAAVQKQLAKLTAENEAIRKQAETDRKQLAVEIQKRRERETIEKVKTKYGHVPRPINEMAQLLMKAEDKGMGAELEQQWAAWNEQAKLGDIFKTAGLDTRDADPAGGGDDAHSQINAIAKSYCDKDPKMSHPAAYDLAYRNNPQLAKQLRAERLRKQRSVVPTT